MSNTHTVPDFASELQATCEDLLPACVISTSWPTVPASSLTLAAFTTQGYVKDLQNLIYVDQPAITLTLPSANGTNWLALTRDVSTAYSGWTRRAGSHYMFQLAGSRPPDVDGLLVFASAVVAGAVITAVTPAPGVTRAERWRTLAGLGTMAPQNASAVAITGGSATFTGLVTAAGSVLVPTRAGNDVIGLAMQVSGAGGTNRWSIYSTGDAFSMLQGQLALGGISPELYCALHIYYHKDYTHGIILRPNDNNTGAGRAVQLMNVGGTEVGSILTSGTGTAFTTTSDVRLKHAITALTGALGVVQALRPVAFRWRSDDSPGHGFLASEVAAVVDGVITGEEGAVNEDGSVRPQMIDMSKLVPWLTSALQEAVAQVQALSVRVASLEDQLGV